MDSLHQNENRNPKCVLTILVLSFTIFTSLIGASLFLVTYIPLSQHQIHGKEAVILYKSISILGLTLIPSAFILTAIFAFIILIRHKLASPPPPPPLFLPEPLAESCDEAGSMRTPILQTKGLMEWKAIEEPDYEYMNELVLAFVREKKKAKEQQIPEKVVGF